MLKTLCLATLVVAASAGGALTKCDGDSDCPSSYCMKGDGKSPPFTCHDCGANCCNSDVDCKGSYCMKDQTKKAPFHCHSSILGGSSATWSPTQAANAFAKAQAAYPVAKSPAAVEAQAPQTGYYSFTFTGDGCGGQCPTSGCYEEDIDCQYCLAAWHSAPPDASYKYNPIVSGGCAGKKVECPECQGMMGLSRYTYNATTVYAKAQAAYPVAKSPAAVVEAQAPQTGYYSFTFTGDGCGGQCPTSGCYEEDIDCQYCLAAWHSAPPDASYKYNPIVSGGCAGKKVECPECQGMMGLSRYTYNATTI